jgi:mRNA interferase MazF
MAHSEKVGLAFFCPIVGQEKGYPFEVKIPQGVAFAGRVKCLDWRAREAEGVFVLPTEVMTEVLDKLDALPTEWRLPRNLYAGR